MNIHEILKRDEKPLIRFWASSVRVRDRRTHMSTVDILTVFYIVFNTRQLWQMFALSDSFLVFAARCYA